MRKYYEANKAALLERAKQYRIENLDKIKAYNKEYRTINKEKLRVSNREFHLRHLERRRQLGRDYSKKNKHIIKDRRKSSISYQLKKLKKGAADRNIEVTWGDEDLIATMKRDCFYCKRSAPENQFHGIDRMDNSKGYVKGNCYPSCWTCNRMKGVMDVNDFLTHCEIIYNAHK